MPRERSRIIRVPKVRRFVAKKAMCLFRQKPFEGFIEGMFGLYFEDIIEEDVSSMKLNVRPIRHSACDSEIIQRFGGIGGKKRIATPLAHVFSFLPYAKQHVAYHFYSYGRGSRGKQLYSIKLEYPFEDIDGEGGLPIGDQWELRANSLDFIKNMRIETDRYEVEPGACLVYPR